MKTYKMYQYPRGVNEGGYSIRTSALLYPAPPGRTIAF